MPRKSTGSTTSKSRKTRSPRKRNDNVDQDILEAGSSVESSEGFYDDAGRRDYKEIITELISNPAVKYVASGIATALLTRMANKMATRYPEISTFIKENLDDLEGKIGEFSREFKGESARH